MEAAEKKKAEQELEQVAKAIGQWRQTREKVGEMPAPLWKEAVTVAKTLGVYQVSKTLGVNYRALQDKVTLRTEGEEERRRRGRPPKVAPPVFVELPKAASPVSTAATESIIEVVAVDGARLTVRLKGASPGDFTALVSAFRGEGR